MSNFKSAAKRKRELAKLDKRHAKEQKRALRKAERSGADVPELAVRGVAESRLADHQRESGAAVPRPKTLAEAVELWKSTKVATPKRR